MFLDLSTDHVGVDLAMLQASLNNERLQKRDLEGTVHRVSCVLVTQKTRLLSVYFDVMASSETCRRHCGSISCPETAITTEVRCNR